MDGGWELLAPVTLDQPKIALETGKPTPVPISNIEAPPVTADRYLIAGEVKYSDASGYLEMWSAFGENRYFSRTISHTGPMAKLEGTADWRPFMLPFSSEPGTIPDRLEINVVLPGGGSVELRDLNLYQTDVPLPIQQDALANPAKLPMWILIGASLALATVFLANHYRKKRAQRELRKMTAADI